MTCCMALSIGEGSILKPRVSRNSLFDKPESKLVGLRERMYLING
jgi:hypothetical protein